MAHPNLAARPRSERRMLLNAEQKLRASGKWPAWEKVPMPNGIPGGGGWCRDIRAAYRNTIFSVLERPLSDGTVHLAITSLSTARPSWWEAMRIKNDLAGANATAVEVYPPMSEVVDDADMYHLWVLPTALPFSLKAGA